MDVKEQFPPGSCRILFCCLLTYVTPPSYLLLSTYHAPDLAAIPPLICFSASFHCTLGVHDKHAQSEEKVASD